MSLASCPRSFPLPFPIKCFRSIKNAFCIYYDCLICVCIIYVILICSPQPFPSYLTISRPPQHYSHTLSSLFPNSIFLPMYTMADHFESSSYMALLPFHPVFCTHNRSTFVLSIISTSSLAFPVMSFRFSLSLP